MSQPSLGDASVKAYYLKLPYRLLAVLIVAAGIVPGLLILSSFSTSSLSRSTPGTYLFALVIFVALFDLCLWLGYQLWRVRLLVSPQGIVFRTIGYSIRSSWKNVASLERVSTPRGPQLGLVLEQPGLDMSGWLSTLLPIMPVLRVISLLRGRYLSSTAIDDRFIPIEPFQSDQLLVDLHQYIPQIPAAATSSEPLAASPIDPPADPLPPDRPHWLPKVGALIGVIALELVFIVLSARAWQGGISPFQTLQVGVNPVDLAFTRDSQTLLVATNTGQLQTWRVSDGTLQQTRQLPSQPVSFALSADGQMMAAGIRDGTVQVWHSDGTLWKSLGKAEQVPCPPCASYPPVAFSSDNQSLAAGFGDGTIHVWRLSDGQELLALKAPSDTADEAINSVAMSLNGQLLAAGAKSLHNTAQLWRLDTGELLRAFPGQYIPESSFAYHVTFAPDGKSLAVSTLDRGIWLIRSSDGQRSHILNVPDPSDHVVWMAAFSPDNQYLAAVTNGGALHIWRLSDNKLLRTVRAHTDQIRQVAFSPDGRYLATGSYDYTVRLWRVADVIQ